MPSTWPCESEPPNNGERTVAKKRSRSSISVAHRPEDAPRLTTPGASPPMPVRARLDADKRDDLARTIRERNAARRALHEIVDDLRVCARATELLRFRVDALTGEPLIVRLDTSAAQQHGEHEDAGGEAGEGLAHGCLGD